MIFPLFVGTFHNEYNTGLLYLQYKFKRQWHIVIGYGTAMRLSWRIYGHFYHWRELVRHPLKKEEGRTIVIVSIVVFDSCCVWACE